MDCKMCDLKTNIRHLLHDDTYIEQCECGWVSGRYICNNGVQEFIVTDDNEIYSIEGSQQI